MTHYWALVVFLGVLAVMAAADEIDRHLRDRFDALDEAADLCRGRQPDNTPEMKRPSVSRQRQPRANDQITSKETSQ